MNDRINTKIKVLFYEISLLYILICNILLLPKELYYSFFGFGITLSKIISTCVITIELNCVKLPVCITGFWFTVSFLFDLLCFVVTFIYIFIYSNEKNPALAFLIWEFINNLYYCILRSNYFIHNNCDNDSGPPTVEEEISHTCCCCLCIGEVSYFICEIVIEFVFDTIIIPICRCIYIVLNFIYRKCFYPVYNWISIKITNSVSLCKTKITELCNCDLVCTCKFTRKTTTKKTNINSLDIVIENDSTDSIDSIESTNSIDSICSICLEQIINKQKGILQECGHVYHFKCIQSSVDNGHSNCPNCRAKILINVKKCKPNCSDYPNCNKCQNKIVYL